MERKPLTYSAVGEDKDEIDTGKQCSFFFEDHSHDFTRSRLLKPKPINIKNEYIEGKLHLEDARKFLIMVACCTYNWSKNPRNQFFPLEADLADFQACYATFLEVYCDSILSRENAENQASSLLKYIETPILSFEEYVTNWIDKLSTRNNKRPRTSTQPDMI